MLMQKIESGSQISEVFSSPPADSELCYHPQTESFSDSVFPRIDRRARAWVNIIDKIQIKPSLVKIGVKLYR